jgi:hypothetical protein
MKKPDLDRLLVASVSQDLDAWFDRNNPSPTDLRDLIFALAEMQLRTVRMLTKLAQDRK